MISLAIITPTYNRAYILKQLYDSIVNQNEHSLNVEWWIVDDGSTDQTKTLIDSFISESRVVIKYFEQENQGKMKAINHVNKTVSTDLWLEVDSDDFLVENAFQLIEAGHHLFDDQKVIGLIFDRVYTNQSVIGKSYNESIQGNIVDFYYQDKIAGDKNFVFRTSVRSKYEYLMDENERFSTEARLYQKLCMDGYEYVYIPKPIVYCEYQEDGYSFNISTIYLKNPRTHYNYYIELINYHRPMKLKKRMFIIRQFIFFNYLCKENYLNGLEAIELIVDKILYVVFYLPVKVRTKKWIKGNI